MKAYVVEKYGKNGVRAAEIQDPAMGPGDVLVRVNAAGINPLDKMVRNGEFKLLLKYKRPFVLGNDLAGVVTRIGAFAEYIAIDQSDIALKPKSPDDGRVRGGPAGGACHLAGAGRLRAGQGRAKGKVVITHQLAASER